MPRTEVIRVSSTPKPTLFSRAWETIRAYTLGPLTSRSPELAKYFSAGGPSAAGIRVDEHSALAYSAVWAAVGLVSDDVASLPLMLYKRLPNGGKDKFESHPLYRLLHDEPNPEMGTMVWRRTMQAHVMLWQNAYAEIERDQVGRPIALWPLIPERVRVTRDRFGTLQYVVTNPDGGEAVIAANNMIHLVGRSHDGSVGCSLVDKAKESIGLALAAEQFGATFFGNGATFGGVVSFKGGRPPEMSDENYKASLEARHQGVKRAHKLLMLYNDAQYKETGVAPDNAQFLETRTHQIREVARWFKIPPHKLADLADATFSNVEQMNTEYFVSAIRPWLVLWEQELGRKLIAKQERQIQFIEHSIEGFLRGDSAARAAFYTALFNIGAITINEVRGYENLDPLDGGDQSFVQVNNLMPLSLVEDHAKAVVDAITAKAESIGHPKDTVNSPISDVHVSDGISNDLKTMGEKLTSLEARLVSDLTESRENAARLDERLAVALDQTKALESERDAALAAVAAKDNALAELDARRSAELADVTGKTAAQIVELEQQWADERVAIMQARDAAQVEKNDLDIMLGVAERERDEAKAGLAAAQEREAELVRSVAALQAERDQVSQAKAEAAAAVESLRGQLAEQREAIERLAQTHAETSAAHAVAKSQADEHRTMAESERSARESLEAKHAATVDRLSAIRQAHRGLIVDAVSRLLQKEADRASKAQASPEKLRAWVESFYPLHAETCRSVLRPVVYAWAPCAGVAADVTLNSLVREHVEQSVADIKRAADTDDPDELAASLAGVLKRWRDERAGDVADRLLAEGERYGH